MTKSAFSIIELMVVVVITAILALIGTMEYKNYSVRSKIAQAMVLINDIGERAKSYYDRKGVFPNLQDIGMYYDPLDPSQSPLANTLSEYTAKYVAYTYLLDQATSYTCPSVAFGGYISNVTDNDYITANQMGSVIAVNQMIVYINKTYKKYCQYYYSKYDPNTDTTTNMTGNWLPGCVNGEDDPNAGDYFPNAGNQC